MLEAERQALRNYLSGLSTIYRNTYAHNDIDGEWYESAMIVLAINSVLQRLGIPKE